MKRHLKLHKESREAHPNGAAKQRQFVAPGDSPGFKGKREISPGGASDQVLSPLRGSILFRVLTPGWRTGLQTVAASQLFICLTLVLALQLNAEIIDRIAVVANGRIITASDIRKERILASVFAEPPKDDAALLQDLIDRSLVEEQIAQFPDVAVTDGEVDVALRPIKAPPDIPPDEFRESVRRRMLRARYFEFRFRQFIRASEEEIQKYYAEVFVPEARARGLTEVPSLQEAAESIQANIIDEKMSQDVELWLDGLRRRSNVEVFK